MFSQVEPVLAGVELDSGFLFALELRDSGGGEDWADVLRKGQQQGLDLKVVVKKVVVKKVVVKKVVVKDAGLGIAAGVSSVFPQAEQREDCFHALYEIGKVRQRLERRAYALIAAEYEAALASERDKKTLRGSRSSRARKAQELRRARERAAKAVENCDRCESAARAAQEALEFADAQTGELRTPQQMQARLEAAGQQMKSMDHKHCRPVGKYLINRAPGLALHMAQVQSQFVELESIHGAAAVRAASRAYRNACDIRDGKRPWDKPTQMAQVRSAISAMESHTPASELVFASIDIILQNRHRASSAMEGFNEGFNAALRPHLYVHKGGTQGFLELFRFYYNRRRRRWGRHKGTSALEVLNGDDAGDWLTELGYPSSTATTLH